MKFYSNPKLLIICIMMLWSTGDPFMFIPSPNIAIYQLARYQCSVDHPNSIIVWHFNGTVSTNIEIEQLGVITRGAGKSYSNLTIPGYPQYNNTVVTCIAFGPVEGDVNATLKIQDKLSKVGNLTCTRQGHCCINCSWSSPFSLDGVPIYGYIINVTNEGDNTQYTTTSNTTSWIYCPSQFGNYTVSIAGNNSAGEGKISTTSVTLPTVTISGYFVTAKMVSRNWTTIYVIKNTTFLDNKPLYVFAHLTPVSDDISPVDGQGSGQFEGDTFIGTVNMENLPDKKKWLISFSLVYNSGLYINVSQPTEFTTFDVQNGSLEVIDSPIGEVCFTCHFVTGSQSQGCFVEYKCLRTDFNGNVTINKTLVDTSTSSKCVTGIHRSVYNVTFYDLDYNNESAFQLTHQHVNGLSPTSSSMVFSMTSTNIIISPSPTTTICPNCDNLGNVQDDSSVTVIIAVAASVLIIIAAVIVILSTVVVLYKAKTRKCKWTMPQKDEKQETEMSTNVPLNQLNYTDVNPSSNGPIAPPILHSTVPYSTVVHETPIIEQYSLVQQYQSSYLENGPSNEEYARLSHSVHVSTQLYDHTQYPHSHTSTPIPPMYSTLPTNGNMTSYISSPDSQYSTLSNKKSDKLTIMKTTELTHKDLVTYVAPHVTTKLREIGTALVLTPSELDDIEENHQGITGMFQLWYETKRRPYTWDTLLMILRSPAVNETELADQFEVQHT